ncbi:DUF6463 family protein [Streptomyces sp. C11-1]|uniref:DUF6463 family protein n=1 Tax=Streptomyces durocortorensis TaxID=2811104 RepID=A0ABY9VW10_9ACTN|nr:DUF6463 family protein [Streptomyces durocortorensis]WNF26931.1 DUF6463 family protein [Streptomyces durocortorensis]
MGRWAGRILMILGAMHLIGLGVQNVQYLDEWFTGALWGLPRDEFVHPRGANGAFWISLGSFAVPMMLLGALVSDLARRNIATPASIGWGLAAWSVVSAAVLEPTPLLLGLIPAVLLIRGARAARSA